MNDSMKEMLKCVHSCFISLSNCTLDLPLFMMVFSKRDGLSSTCHGFGIFLCKLELLKKVKPFVNSPNGELIVINYSQTVLSFSSFLQVMMVRLTRTV